jgi:hypothetical protein
MDFQLDEDQSVLVDAIQSACQPYRELPADSKRVYSYFAADLQRKLKADGYLDPIQGGLTALDAALIVLETARLPVVVEVAASALVAPHVLPGQTLDGPIALLSGDLRRPQRLLPIAKAALVDVGDDAVLIDIDPKTAEPIESILAYPYGRFVTPPDLSKGRRLGPAALAALRQWWRVGLALECAAAADAATLFTVDYVRERRVFGRPVGSFQAVQHRLAQCHQIARAMRFLALYAAWSGTAQDAAMAAAYAQQHVHKLVFDLHQFNGGMGVTNEHKLHFWTYRLRALQSEVGGAQAAALAIADERWPIQAA